MRPTPAREPLVTGAVTGPVTCPMTWRIHRERVLLAGWGRAILLQIAHPKVAQGVAEHSAFTREPFGRLRRLHRTLSAMLALTFGSEAEAGAAADRINAIHDRVHGRLPAAAGRSAAGAAYDAHDPALLTWVHATLVESFLLTYRRFVGPVTAAEADRYCAEAAAIEPTLGIPAGRLPRTEAELRGYVHAMLASGTIEVTETARRLAGEVIRPPAPAPLRPLLRLAALPAIGMLPPGIRAAYGLPWDGRRERVLRLMSAMTRRVLPLMPSVLRCWAVARRAERRR
jgi:uncharacterized protein (DUF2236 family)